MLSKLFRLKKNVQFHYVYRKGNKSFSKYLTLVFVTSRISDPKIGFSISKKMGKAVNRNLMKRRLREGAKILLPHLKKGYNMVFVVKESMEQLSLNEVVNEMKIVLTKAGLLHD